MDQEGALELSLTKRPADLAQFHIKKCLPVAWLNPLHSIELSIVLVAGFPHNRVKYLLGK